jgi:tetratricopeptide (TPR) repeat protein
MPFEASSSEPRGEWVGELAAVALTRELRAAGVPAIRRDDRLQAMERLRVPSVPVLSHASVIRLAAIVGATVAVVGRVEATPTEFVLRARPIRIDTGRMAPEIVERGPRNDVFAIAARVAKAIAPGRTPAEDAPPPPVAAFEPFIRGLVAATPATKVTLLTQALEQAPGLDDARFALWDVYSNQGEHQRALDSVRGVRAGGADGRRAAFLAAVSALQLGRYQSASAGFDALHRADPDAALANDIGVAQLREPAPGPKATERFREATQLDPADADLFFNLGYAHWIAREYPQAVTALRDAVRRNPTDDDAHYVLGAALQAAGQIEEAAREKDLARRLSSAYSEMEARQGAATVPRGLERVKTEIDAAPLARVESAIAAAGQRDQRELVAFYVGNGQRLFQGERDAEALSELRRAVYLSPYESEAHLLIGRILLRGGRVREAVDAFKVSVWSRDSVQARLALAEAYVAGKDVAAARAELQAARGLEPQNAAVASRLAELSAP